MASFPPEIYRYGIPLVKKGFRVLVWLSTEVLIAASSCMMWMLWNHLIIWTIGGRSFWSRLLMIQLLSLYSCMNSYHQNCSWILSFLAWYLGQSIWSRKLPICCVGKQDRCWWWEQSCGKLFPFQLSVFSDRVTQYKCLSVILTISYFFSC